MKVQELWEGDETLIEFISNLLYEGKLLLVLGSGVSTELGLPTWKTLVQRLYTINTKSIDPALENNLGKLIELLRNNEYKNNEDEFRKDLQEQLYLNFGHSFKELLNISLLPSLGAIIMSSTRGNTSNVVTFNFDNILELYLKYHGFTINSCLEDKHWNDNSDVQIYHPNGYIPALPDEPPYETELIFDSADFMRRISNQLHPWNIKLKALMSSHFCIYIGLSGDDLGFTSILDNVQKNHILQSHKSTYWGITFLKNKNELTLSNWEKYGVFIKQVENFEEIPEFLFKVCQLAAEKRKSSSI